MSDARTFVRAARPLARCFYDPDLGAYVVVDGMDDLGAGETARAKMGEAVARAR